MDAQIKKIQKLRFFKKGAHTIKYLPFRNGMIFFLLQTGHDGTLNK